MATLPKRGQRAATNKKTTTAKKKALPKIPKDMSKMKLTRAETPAQRRQQASLNQQAEYARSKRKTTTAKKKPTTKKK